MAKNKLEDLKNHLFAQLERLNDEDISEEKMQNEIEKSKAMEGIAKQIIDVEKMNIEKAKIIISAVEKDIIVPTNHNKTIGSILSIEE